MTGTIAEFRNATRPTNEIAAFVPRDDGHNCRVEKRNPTYYYSDSGLILINARVEKRNRNP